MRVSTAILFALLREAAGIKIGKDMMKTCGKLWLVLVALSASLSVHSQPAIPIEWFDFPPGPSNPPAFSTAYGSLPLVYTSNLISSTVSLDQDWYCPSALILDSTNLSPAFLEYAVTDSNGVHNFSYDRGTVLFYTCPNWASVSQGSGATGPGATAYFIGSGDWSTGSPNGLFTIYADPYGSNIYVAGVGAGVTNVYARAGISWASNTFHQIGVEWSSSGSSRNPGIRIYLDGALAATGLKLSIVPAMGADSNGVWTNGLYVGSDNTGGQQMRAAMWSLTTWDCMYGGWYADDWPVISNALAAWQATLGGGGFGGMMGQPAGPGYPTNAFSATNYSEYNQFWVMTSLTNQTNVLVTITNTLSNLTYNILTNSALGSNAPPWGIFATVSASNSSVALSNAIPLGNNPLFVQGELLGYITDGLVAYWKMIDGSGTNATDFSGNSLALPLINSPSWGSNDLILNGTNQYGDAGSNALTNLDNHDMTICAWINTLSTALQGIVVKDYYDFGSHAYGGWWFAIESNQPSWNLLSFTNLFDSGSAIVPLGQWVFVAVTWHYPNNSNNEARFYINGQLNSNPSGNNISEALSGQAHLFVGNLQLATNAQSYLFDGSIRDVAIYDRVLSAGEILTNFFNTEPSTNVPYPDLLYYKMTEYGQRNAALVLSNSVTNSAMVGLANGIVWNYNTNLASLTEVDPIL
jgi:hypothetical protein